MWSTIIIIDIRGLGSVKFPPTHSDPNGFLMTYCGFSHTWEGPQNERYILLELEVKNVPII